MVKAEVNMITDLVNQVIGGIIPAEWEPSTIENCYKGKRDSLQRGSKNLYFAFVDLEKAFDKVFGECCMMGFEETRYGRMAG